MVDFWDRYCLDINYHGLVASDINFRDCDGYCEWIKDCMGFFETMIWIIEGTNKLIAVSGGFVVYYNL